ncbi:MAG: transcriptional regulator [Ramlibacter sp.]|nr:transcriptional regulator [Ramlibacter sp.]
MSDLAQPHGMSLPGFMKQLGVLGDAGLVQREKEGRTVRCALAPDALEDAAMWLAHDKFWNLRLDAPGRYLCHQEQVNPWPRTCRGRARATSRVTTPSPAKSLARPDRPQAVSAWFGPGEENSALLAELDMRPGGRYRSSSAVSGPACCACACASRSRRVCRSSISARCSSGKARTAVSAATSSA